MSRWPEIWMTPEYQSLKQRDVDIMLAYYEYDPPSTMLEIGCGMAWEAKALNEAYDTKLWFIDGDARDNLQKEKNNDTGWARTTERFDYYNNLADLEILLQNNQVKYECLIDASNIDLPEQTFDLIYSSLSCGFHYKASCYRDLIEKHSHSNTKVIVDLRKRSLNDQPEIELIDILDDYKKHIKAQIRFI